MFLVHVAFIYQSNLTRVNLEADRDPLFQEQQGSDASVHTFSNEPIVPEFILTEPKLPSVDLANCA